METLEPQPCSSFHKPGTATVVTRDVYSNEMAVGGSQLRVWVEDLGASSDQSYVPVEDLGASSGQSYVSVEDLGAGRYLARYTSTRRGAHLLHVTLGGAHLLGSPHAFQVLPARTNAAASLLAEVQSAAAAGGHHTKRRCHDPTLSGMQRAEGWEH